MTNLKDLENKIQELEKRVKQLEENISSIVDVKEKEWMDALYNRARELVIKNHKASVIFLQKKLLIDYHRAERLLVKLRENGVLDRLSEVETKRIHTKK